MHMKLMDVFLKMHTNPSFLILSIPPNFPQFASPYKLGGLK
jgi:hypothetical protein